MMDGLQRIGIDVADLRMLTNIYWEQKAVVRIENDRSDWIRIQRGVRQGCVLSPNLFSVYSQKIVDKLEDMEGVRVGGMNITNIRYADDTVLMADTKEKLQRLVNVLNEECSRYGLGMNIQKT